MFIRGLRGTADTHMSCMAWGTAVAPCAAPWDKQWRYRTARRLRPELERALTKEPRRCSRRCRPGARWRWTA